MYATETGLRLICTDSYRLAFRNFEGMMSGSNRKARSNWRSRCLRQRLVAPVKDDEAGTIVFRHSDLDAVFGLANAGAEITRFGVPHSEGIELPAATFAMVFPRRSSPARAVDGL